MWEKRGKESLVSTSWWVVTLTWVVLIYRKKLDYFGMNLVFIVLAAGEMPKPLPFLKFVISTTTTQNIKPCSNLNFLR